MCLGLFDIDFFLYIYLSYIIYIYIFDVKLSFSFPVSYKKYMSTLTRISRENICLFVLFLSLKYIILVPISWKMRSMAFLTYKKVYFNCFYQLK